MHQWIVLKNNIKIYIKTAVVLFIHQLMHQWVVLKTILKFTLKQFRHVSVLQLNHRQGARYIVLTKVTVVF